MRNVDVLCAAALAEGDCTAAGVWLAAVTDCHEPDMDMDDAERVAAFPMPEPVTLPPPTLAEKYDALSVEVSNPTAVGAVEYPPILFVAATSDAKVAFGLDGCAGEAAALCGLLANPHVLGVEDVGAGGFHAEAPTIRTSDLCFILFSRLVK